MIKFESEDDLGINEQCVQNPCWLMISSGMILASILGIIVLQERGIPNSTNQYFME